MVIGDWVLGLGFWAWERASSCLNTWRPRFKRCGMFGVTTPFQNCSVANRHVSLMYYPYDMAASGQVNRCGTCVTSKRQIFTHVAAAAMSAANREMPAIRSSYRTWIFQQFVGSANYVDVTVFPLVASLVSVKIKRGVRKIQPNVTLEPTRTWVQLKPRQPWAMGHRIDQVMCAAVKTTTTITNHSDPHGGFVMIK